MSPPPPPAPRAPRSSALLIGVLGGIASGKSRVGRLLAGSTGALVDADRLAREVLETPEAAAFLRERLGPETVDERGRPRREAIADRVFGDEEARRTLEAWTHPRVRARILEELDAARALLRNPIVLDVPLLLENDAQHGLARACDLLVFVDADESERERRARANRNWKPGERERREAAQWSMEDKRKAATHVISNRAGVEELEASVLRLRRELDLD